MQKDKRIEGFILTAYNNKLGYVMECGLFHKKDKNIYRHIAHVRDALNEFRWLTGRRLQVRTLRNSMFKNRGDGGHLWEINFKSAKHRKMSKMRWKIGVY